MTDAQHILWWCDHRQTHLEAAMQSIHRGGTAQRQQPTSSRAKNRTEQVSTYSSIRTAWISWWLGGCLSSELTLKLGKLTLDGGDGLVDGRCGGDDCGENDCLEGLHGWIVVERIGGGGDWVMQSMMMCMVATNKSYEVLFVALCCCMRLWWLSFLFRRGAWPKKTTIFWEIWISTKFLRGVARSWR